MGVARKGPQEGSSGGGEGDGLPLECINVNILVIKSSAKMLPLWKAGLRVYGGLRIIFYNCM